MDSLYSYLGIIVFLVLTGCGLPVPEGVQGKSLAPLLADPNAAWDKPAYTVLKRGPTLGKSVRTIETHRFNIMKKLNVNNAVDMINKTIRENLI